MKYIVCLAALFALAMPADASYGSLSLQLGIDPGVPVQALAPAPTCGAQLGAPLGVPLGTAFYGAPFYGAGVGVGTRFGLSINQSNFGAGRFRGHVGPRGRFGFRGRFR